jgi:hypothetical protein
MVRSPAAHRWCFQFGQDLLDGVEVRAVRREQLTGCPTHINGFAHPRDVMGGEVIPDDDVALRQSGTEKCFHIGQEQGPSHRPRR